MNSNIDNPLVYDKYIVAFSGGKDSIASFLHLLDIGVPKEKIELWHHEIDGKGGTFMDWEVTTAYCKAFAAAFNVPIYFSWKEGGFKREMLRDDSLTAPMWFETPSGEIKKARQGKARPRKKPCGVCGSMDCKGCRQKFPQVSPDLSQRWCSAYLKIDVCSAAIRNQKRFEGIKTVVISGERAEESKNRANYKILEPDRADNRGGKRVDRYVDRWRNVKNWSEKDVWAIIERYKVRVHPCYYMGWNRCSCKFCIFGNKNQFASAYKVSPSQGESLMIYEESFGTTLKRDTDIVTLITDGTAYESITEELINISTSYDYNLDIFMEDWFLPAGAYGDSCGPT